MSRTAAPDALWSERTSAECLERANRAMHDALRARAPSVANPPRARCFLCVDPMRDCRTPDACGLQGQPRPDGMD